MSFRHKLTILMIVIFFVFTSICSVFIVSKYNFMAISREIKIADKEELFIKNSIIAEFNAVKIRGGILDDRMYNNIIDFYNGIFNTQDIQIEIFNNHLKEKRKISESNGFIIITDSLGRDYGDMALRYSRDINSFYKLQSEWNAFSVKFSLLIIVLLACTLTITIRRLTKPLELLAQKTDQLAEGNYSNRINIRGTDEFSELANKFDNMSQVIQTKIVELETTIDEKQNLVDNIAHELRTPLTSLQGYTELLMNAKMNEEQRLTSLKYLDSETRRLKELINKLLEISVISNETIEKSTFSVLRLFEDVLKLEYAKIKEMNINFKTNSDCSEIYGDETLIKSLVINLVDNAINASKQKGEVNINIYDNEKYCLIEVSDHGVGIREDNVEKIFDAFYRVDKVRSRKNGGVGLGLNFCKKIVDAHEGKINVTSTEKVGTTIEVILPKLNNFKTV